jgi:hypothetical protein
VKTYDSDSIPDVLSEVPSTDRSRKGRGPAATLRKAEVGLLLASGEEKTLGPAMRRVGYADSTSRQPSNNGVTVFSALEAMREAFPSIPSPADVAAKGLVAVNELLSDPDASTDRKAQVGYTMWAKHAELGGTDVDTGIDTLGPYRNAEAVKLLDRLEHVARVIDRMGSVRFLAALVARRDEIELGVIEAHEREAVPVLRRSIAAALGETLATPHERSSSNLARVYRRRRAGGFTVAEQAKPELRRDRR